MAYNGQYEYKFDNLDGYLKIQTQIWINSTTKINYMLTKLNAIKVCKLLYICAIIYDFSYYITNNKTITIFYYFLS